jgi:hypothetical protein
MKVEFSVLHHESGEVQLAHVTANVNCIVDSVIDYLKKSIIKSMTQWCAETKWGQRVLSDANGRPNIGDLCTVLDELPYLSVDSLHKQDGERLVAIMKENGIEKIHIETQQYPLAFYWDFDDCLVN